MLILDAGIGFKEINKSLNYGGDFGKVRGCLSRTSEGASPRSLQTHKRLLKYCVPVYSCYDVVDKYNEVVCLQP